jgi:drug/metabolite transporter (DMT)-like permease
VSPSHANLLKGLGWIGLSVLCWSPLFSVAKRTLPYIDAFSLGTIRYSIGALLFIAVLVAIEGRQALRYEGRLPLAAISGVIGIVGFNLLVWIGIGYTRPEHAAIIMALQTPLAALAVWATRGQRPAAFTIGCVAVAIGGVFFVVTKGTPGQILADAGQTSALFGDLLVLLGAISWIAYGLSAARFTGWSPLRMTVLTCIPGALGLWIANIFAVALGVSSVPSLGTILDFGWQLAYFSICTVVLGVLGFNAANKRLGPLNTMLMLNLVPVGVFAIEAGLGRSFAPIELAGAAVVIGALVANNLYLRGVSTAQK